MIRCKIVTPEGEYRTLDASMINIVSVNGQLGILPHHMPLVTMLKISEMSIITQNQKRENFAVSGGMFYFENGLASNDPNIDVRRAELALSKALNRIHVKQ